MIEEFDKTYLDCYNYVRKRLEVSELDTPDKIHVTKRLYEDFRVLLEDEFTDKADTIIENYLPDKL